MIIWRNEFTDIHDPARAVSAEAPSGAIEITRVEERDEKHYIWFAPVPARNALTAAPEVSR